MRSLSGSFLYRRLLSMVAIWVMVVACAFGAHAQDTSQPETSEGAVAQADVENIYVSVRTESPRRTLISFVRLRDQLEISINRYRNEKTAQTELEVVSLLEEIAGLIDLSGLPNATRREISIDTVGYLLDILGRVQLPAMQDIPRAETEDGDEVLFFRIPGTPLAIDLIKEGDRAGEYLFSDRTVRNAPRFYNAIQGRVLQTSTGITSWSDRLPQVTGWVIPAAVDEAIPDSLKAILLGTPIWKIFSVVVLIALSTGVFWIWLQFVRKLSNKAGKFRHYFRILGPLAALPIIYALSYILRLQINIGGTFASITDSLLTLGHYLALTALAWLGSVAIFETFILSPRIPEYSLNANLLRLLSRIFGVFAGIVVLAIGAQNIGVPVFSIVAGLGVGGLAIALALRPTIENLIGGILLYLDKPVRVGDFCEFGDTWGTVEDIGVRSTHVRALDRTLVSIPNAKFADMQLINWTLCDEMMVQMTIGLRYETSTDQLRFVLVKLREMAHAHPMIDSEAIRIRAVGFGTSSLDIEIRMYIMTGDWDEFFAVREDVILRTKEVVEASGTSFAFPSMTLYSATDKGLNEKRSETSSQAVEAMRQQGHLPFPRFSDRRLDELDGTLDYPPAGSPHFRRDADILRESRGEDHSSDPKDEPIADQSAKGPIEK